MRIAANDRKEPNVSNFCSAAKVGFRETGKTDPEITADSGPSANLQDAAVAARIADVHCRREIYGEGKP
ncbi:MAG: hypothetical protein ABJ246_03250 [Paracoccaceae bacterium]